MCELVHSFVEAVATPIKVSVAPSPGAAGRVASTPTTVPNDNGIPKTPLKSCVEPSSVEAGPFVASGCEAVPDNRVIPESTPVKSRGGGGSSPGEAASCAGSTPTTVPFEVVLPTPMKPCVSSSPADAATPPTVPFNVVLPKSGDCWGSPDVGKSPGPSTAERDAEKDLVSESRLQTKTISSGCTCACAWWKHLRSCLTEFQFLIFRVLYFLNPNDEQL